MTDDARQGSAEPTKQEAAGNATTDDVLLKTQQLFPRLQSAQLGRLLKIGRERTFDEGEILFETGHQAVPFFVVLEGAIEIFHRSSVGLHVIATHGPGGFSGDVGQLSSQRAIVAARARGHTRVLEVPSDRLRTLLQNDAELGEIILRAFILRRAAMMVGGFADMVLVGSAHSAKTLQLREFLTRNDQPHQYLDIDRDPEVREMLDRLHVGIDEVPVMLCDARVLRNPTIQHLAACLGIDQLSGQEVHDLVVIGAGPAGLAAAVYGASEGLDVLVLEANAPGGQAGSSSRIENYLGFPTGISGNELAYRAAVQAEKFGAKLSVTRTAARLHCDQRPYRVELLSGESIATRAIVIASGARYRRIDVANLDRFEGVGIYYGATFVEANLCAGDEVIVVGGGNSAGQAAVFLSARCSKVHLLVRGEGLAATMSRYLIRRIEETPNIVLRPRTEIQALEGVDSLQRVTCRDAARGEQTTLGVRHVFLMIGADPNTKWLDGCLELDGGGFIKTGTDLTRDDLLTRAWPLKRQPFYLETSLPGVFAVGDVRAQSVKRVAAAVGEGSGAVPLVHRVLAE
jgi:thioredoxin reductase (NADPH)